MKKISLDELKEKLLYKKIKAWDMESITLEDGTKLSIKSTYTDCCSGGFGRFGVEGTPSLDAVITDIKVGEYEPKWVPNYDTFISETTITIYHNQVPLCEAYASANAGNGGFYGATTSLVLGDYYVPVVSV